MVTLKELYEAKRWSWDFVKKSGIPLMDSERENIEVADLGLGEIETTGLQILTLAGTDWVGVKLLILRPYQFFPQHRHPPSADGTYPGKTEIFRGHYGQAYLYVPGEQTPGVKSNSPEHRRKYCTVWHEVNLAPGKQHVCPPNTCFRQARKAPWSGAFPRSLPMPLINLPIPGLLERHKSRRNNRSQV